MKSIFTIAFAACISASGVTAEATTAFCFPGWFGGWGAGYAPGPYYAGRPYFGGWSTGYYGSYYGGGCNSGACGCSPCNSCSPCGSCSPCSTGCSTGSCGSDCGVISSDSYTPRKDPNFDEGTGERGRDLDDEYERDRERRWRDRAPLDEDLDSERSFGDGDSDLGRPERGEPDFLRERNGLDSRSDREFDGGLDRDSGMPDTRFNPEESDSFSSGSPDGDDNSFRSSPDGIDEFQFDRGTNKPDISAPMPESELPSGSDEVLSPPNDDSTFLQRGQLSQRDARLSHTADRTRIRLTGFSGQSHRKSHTRWSGRSHNRSSDAKRWIGIPAADGRARL